MKSKTAKPRALPFQYVVSTNRGTRTAKSAATAVATSFLRYTLAMQKTIMQKITPSKRQDKRMLTSISVPVKVETSAMRNGIPGGYDIG